MIFDTHAHYDSGAFNADRRETLEAVHAAGVGLILDPGCDVRSSRMAIELAERYPERRIYTVDSLCASMGQGLLVYLAWQEKKRLRTSPSYCPRKPSQP